MKKSYLLLVALLLSGCGQGPQGAGGLAGPQGAQGNPGGPTYDVAFQTGVFPTSSYAGVATTWVDLNAPMSLTPNTYIRVKSGPVTFGRILLEFNISTLPVNAVVTNASLILKTSASTTLGIGNYSIGVHDAGVSTMTGSFGCHWNTVATWDWFDGSNWWDTCSTNLGYPMTPGQSFNATPMDVVTFTSTAVNGKSVIYGWKLNPSVVQGWVSGNNYGLVLASEGEGTDAVGNLDFNKETAATTTDRPALLVSYSIP